MSLNTAADTVHQKCILWQPRTRNTKTFASSGGNQNRYLVF